MSRLLQRWLDAGRVRDLDVHFARTLGADDDAVAAAFALASQATGLGHVCLDLTALAARGGDAGDWRPPPLAEWTARLRAHPHVGAPGEARPLILDHAGRLYLYRYWAYERRIAERLAALAAPRTDAPEAAWLRRRLEERFPDPPPGATVDWQRVGAAVALLRGLCVLSGGPGTGKTTTMARVLALLAEHRGPRLRVALAAPTGKAAARMQDSVRALRAAGALPAEVAAVLPEEAHTLHRLLGLHPLTRRPRHGPDHPLPHDVVVVDESSMVDVALMARLLDALPPHARLLLLGDKDQLASVEAGSVLADLCGPAPGFTPGFADTLREATGQPVPAGPSPAPGPLQDSIVLLRHSHRFRDDGGIGALARAVQSGDTAAVTAALRARDPAVRWRDTPDLRARDEALARRAPALFEPALARARPGADPLDVLRAYTAWGVLCAHREGPAGARRINRVVEAALAGAGLVPPDRAWYPGRPVMVLGNDYTLRLFNGDIGVVLPDDDGTLRVWFPAPDGGPPRAFAPARLPAHETVYAMTVHKSQGSEFARVLLILPERPTRVLTRELLYTGITRAREAVEVWGPAEVVAAAAATPTRRSSGLRDALWPQAAAQ
ncbi:exodeoxyribonuclease V subunit alpha [Inmirania thermothiophila]|uniref:RecBCD enzyme subunit RecD n=1 Tax=Inmirania thermothiophila TaxID=1750597 RepID=A0A3N1Y144_9GAMM|nr:exodeoxyribonuclease V subunit alpha [Inmirania thermothiophila]ROR32559.1 DNA helicase/exodeoxyribonuclease V alpha subunit [Inmirania thermothiophila]